MSIRGVAAMTFPELAIDWLASAEAFVSAVPELDRPLAKFPAQAHLFAAEARGEIDQARVQILYQAAAFVDSFERSLKPFRAVVATRPYRNQAASVDRRPARHRDALRCLAQFCVERLIFPFCGNRFAQR